MKHNLCLFLVVAGGLITVGEARAEPGDAEPPVPPSQEPQGPSDPSPITNEATAMFVPAVDVDENHHSYRAYQDWRVANDRASKPGSYSYAWHDPTLKSGIGVGAAIGGGVGGFTDRTMRDTMRNQVAGVWGARASFGTQVPLGIDVSYIGTAAGLNTPNQQSNGLLVGTTVEAALRYNVLPHNVISPYIFAGMGWQRYDVQNANFSQTETGLRASDDLVEFPAGVGIALHDPSGFSADVRGTFRTTSDSTLVLEPSGSYAKLYSWAASADLGYEF